MVFNFINKDDTLTALCRYFSLKDEVMVLNYLSSNDWDYRDYTDFVKEFNIPFDDIEVDKVFITCKHITTFHDNKEALKKYGLLNLKEALEKDSPLNNFLAERKIKIDVDNRADYLGWPKLSPIQFIGQNVVFLLTANKYLIFHN